MGSGEVSLEGRESIDVSFEIDRDAIRGIKMRETRKYMGSTDSIEGKGRD